MLKYHTKLMLTNYFIVVKTVSKCKHSCTLYYVYSLNVLNYDDLFGSFSDKINYTLNTVKRF